MSTIAIQGESASYSHEAAVAALGSGGTLLCCSTFAAVFDALEDGRADLAVVPVENTTMGPIISVLDLLRVRRPWQVGEARIPVRHCLIVADGRELTDVHRVASHPAALAQCGRFLRTRPDWVAVSVDDTAGAVRALAEGRLPAEAVIASRRAAEHYGCEVALEDIQDEAANTTRFLILKPRPRLERRPRLEHRPALERRPGDPHIPACQARARYSSDSANS